MKRSLTFGCGTLLAAVAWMTMEAQQPATPAAQAQLAEAQFAHFHHLHLNSTDPKAAVDFYTKHFESERAKFAGADALWTQKSWLLFNKVSRPPAYDVVSSLYHMGWGAEDMKAEYQRQIGLGAKFDTPLTDGADLFGNGNPGRAYFAYVEGPDHALIEINTTNNHIFQHIHLLSADPVRTSEWYQVHFGSGAAPARPGNSEPRVVNGLQIFPMTFVRVDNVSFIWFPKEFASKGVYKKQWEGRTDFATSRGRVIDHFAFSVDNLDETLARFRKEGVKVLQQPKKILGGKLRSAFIEAPDNVQIELVEGHASRQ